MATRPEVAAGVEILVAALSLCLRQDLVAQALGADSRAGGRTRRYRRNGRTNLLGGGSRLSLSIICVLSRDLTWLHNEDLEPDARAELRVNLDNLYEAAASPARSSPDSSQWRTLQEFDEMNTTPSAT